jgi:hypothetical protein
VTEPPSDDAAARLGALGWTGPTSDPATWVRVPPNTVISAAGALTVAAERYRQAGRMSDADVCDELSDRLTRHLANWVGGARPEVRSECPICGTVSYRRSDL